MSQKNKTRLEKMRERAGISVGEVAAKAGLSFGYVSAVLHGKYMPGPDAIEALAGSLGVLPVSLRRAARATFAARQQRARRAA